MNTKLTQLIFAEKIMIMKKFKIILKLCFSLGLIGLTFQFSSAQISNKPEEKKNFVKVNLPSLFLGTASLQYERILSQHWSVDVGARYTLGFSADLSLLLTDEDSVLTSAVESSRLSTKAAYLEGRYYFKGNAGRGFYTSAIAKYNTWRIGFDFNKIDSTAGESVNMYGNWTSITTGITLGYQFKIYNNLYADWWIAGLGFGYGKLEAHLESPDFNFAQDKVDEINKILQKPDGGILNKKKSYVTNNEINLESNWDTVFSFRLGFCLAYRF